MEFLGQQAKALADVAKWMKTPAAERPPVYRLMGYAGTGKTTLAKHLSQDFDTMFMAYTGKAASVLRKKGCPGASTIHRAIYDVKKNEETGELEFELNKFSMVAHRQLLVVDEVSMVNEEIGNDLLSFKVPILVLGDPAQLPPVKGTGFFISGKPDTVLTEIHRQAADNPIIKLATQVREYRFPSLGAYGESRVMRDVPDEDFIAADQILVGKNDTRRSFNAYARELLGYDVRDILPVEEEKTICLRNNHKLGFLNGTMWRVEKVSGKPETLDGITADNFPSTLYMRLRSDDEPDRLSVYANVLTHAFLGKDIPQYHDPEDIEMDYGYAITVHKSQGSEWPNVVILNESGVFRENQWKWLYTAITRASEKVTLVTRSRSYAEGIR